MTFRTARWIALGVPAAIYVVSYFHRVAPGVVAGDLMATFAVSAAALGVLSAVYPWVFAVMTLLGGSLADAVGPRWTLASGAALMGLGAALFGLAPAFPLAIAGRLVVSLGASVILVSWLALAAEWSRPEEFATIGGFTQAVGNVGGLIAVSPLAVLVEAIGWRQSFVLTGAMTLALAVAAVTLIRDRPEALGLPPLNRARPAQGGGALGAVLRGIPPLVRNPRTWPPVLAATGTYATLTTLLGLWGVPYLTQVYGLPRVQAANLTALLAIGMGIGSPLVGWLSDHWLGLRRLPMAVLTILYALCWVPLVLPASLRPPATLLGPCFLVMGLASAALVLVWSCVREVNDPGRVGMIVGFCNSPIFLTLALMQWVSGVVLDAQWTGLLAGSTRVYPPEAYRAVFGLCLAVAAAAAVCACLVTETRCRNVWTPKRDPRAGRAATL